MKFNAPFMAATLAATLAVAPALAQVETVPSEKSVTDTMDALVAAVEDAGATVFARVDHGAGAASVDMELAPAELLIFGNPMLGTPAMQDDMRAGLMLPLRVLVFEDASGSVFLTYESVEAMFEGLGIPKDAAYRQRMTGALGNLTAKAAE